MTTLVWFRQDLRLADNPALHAAAALPGAVIPVFLHDTGGGPWAAGGASRWWLHHSLAALSADLAQRGSRLTLRATTDCGAALLELAHATGATTVVWNRLYEPAHIARDAGVKASLRAAGLTVHSYNATLLREPWDVKTKTGTPFQVFTPFWRQCLSLPDPALPLPAPSGLRAPAAWPDSPPLDSLALRPTRDWAREFPRTWTPGSAAAHARLAAFLRDAFADYKEARNRPDLPATSRLSPHLHFGEIGPREIWHATREFGEAHGAATTWRSSHFLSEVGWREFAYHLLYHFPQTPEKPLRADYERFPWRPDAALLRAWQRGRTGYPIVDAGLRELWTTGWMHNRVRMIAASFLVKDLLQPWQDGARWFWDTLVDADLAANTLGWQWTAGCGADAAPFFRIFNPVLQGQKFDPAGVYVRHWVPELAGLPNEWLHEPWNAPAAVLAAAKVRLDDTYPRPIVDHGAARDIALAALQSLKTPPGPPAS
jgi:deoxyribodipyrimidine photo-lyase